jgi:hypothetical protein
MMPLVYFMTYPSYVDRRRCRLLEKNLHFLCITIYVQSNIFTKVHVIAMYRPYTSFFDINVYNLNGPVVRALANKSDDQSSSHARILKKI